MTARPIKLSVVRSERNHDAAKSLRREMYGHIGNIVRDAGDDIAGYAVVVWDKDGWNWSNIRAGGPIKSRLLPTFVGDALTQHVAVDLGKFEK